MATTDLDIDRLQKLADELTEVAPPPKSPHGLNMAVKRGRWIVQKVGAGMYAIRAEYQTEQNTAVVVKIDDEMSGFAKALVTAMKFAIQIASSSRHYWLPV